MGFVAAWNLSNLIKWAHCDTFVSYTSGWVAMCWIVGVPFSVMRTTTCKTIFGTHVVSQAVSLMTPCLSAKLADHKEDQSLRVVCGV